ncbi:MAG: YCF48-related protein [Anaerolineales bacterium]
MKKALAFFLSLVVLSLSACGGGGWRQALESRAQTLTLLVGFNDSTYGLSVGDDGYLYYTGDGGQSWQAAENQSMGLYGLEIVDGQVAYACGTGNNVRATTDGGLTWQVRANFGASFPNHCRFLSFADAQTGWAATPTLLGATADGGQSWRELTLPEGVTGIAALSMFAPGEGFLLDVSGALYATNDDGATWSLAGRLPLGEITIETKSYPTAAMRFQNASSGMVVLAAIVGGAGQVTAFHTADGGATWTQENTPAPYGALYLSRDGRYLTVLTPPSAITVWEYK